MYWYDWSFFGMHVFWWAFWLLLIISLLAWATPVPRRRVRTYDDPIQILRRRFAAGEMTAEDYEQRKERLERDISAARRRTPPNE